MLLREEEFPSAPVLRHPSRFLHFQPNFQELGEESHTRLFGMHAGEADPALISEALLAVLLSWVPFWHRRRQHHLHSLLSCHRLFDLLFGSVLLFLFMFTFLQLLLWSLLIARKEKMCVLLVKDRFLLLLLLINLILSSLPSAQTTAWTPLSSRGYAPFLLCSC